MTGKNDETNKLRCSFCGKTQDQVKKLIAGPNVYICDECIDLCADIIDEEYETLAKEDEVKELPKPKQIKEILDQYVIGQDRANRHCLWQFTTTIREFSATPRQTMWNCRKAISCW